MTSSPKEKTITPFGGTGFFLERVTGVEPVSQPWQGRVIATIRYARFEGACISPRNAGRVDYTIRANNPSPGSLEPGLKYFNLLFHFVFTFFDSCFISIFRHVSSFGFVHNFFHIFRVFYQGFFFRCFFFSKTIGSSFNFCYFSVL